MNYARIGINIQSLALAAYFVIGFVQLFAIIAGVKLFLGIESTLIALLLSVFLTYIPIIGSIIGVYGAVHAWSWSYLAAILLFFIWIILYAISSIFLYIATLKKDSEE